MSESPRKFTIERTESIPLSNLEEKIDNLYSAARDNENPEVFDELYAAIASFSEELVETFSKEELYQVPAYHRLIKSGLPTESAAEGGESAQTKQEIEEQIEKFVAEKLKAMSPERMQN